MSLTPEEEGMATRLGLYNGNAYNAQTNPQGFDRGGNQAGVFVSMLRDVAGWGRAVLREAAQLLVLTSEARRLADEDAANTLLDRIATGQDRAATAASAGEAAASAASLRATSTTSVAISTGAKVFTTQAGKNLSAGLRVAITNDASPTTRIMYGNITAYAGTSMTVAVDNIVGAGTYAAWTIRLSGERGDVGLQPWGPVANWNSNVSYSATAPRSVVTFDGETYVARVTHVSGADFVAANWDKVAAKAVPTSSDVVATQLAYSFRR